MKRRSSFDKHVPGTVALLVAGLALGAGPAAAQLARPRTVAPDAPKLLVVPFVRDAGDSAISLVLADAVRERMRTVHLDKFNTLTRANLNTVLTESGFPVDVPLDASTVRNVVRFMNARFVIEGSMIRRGDSILVVARLAEATGTTPQAATISVMAGAARIGTSTGNEIANRLADNYGTFDEVAECRRRLDLGNIQGASDKAAQALRQFPNSPGAWLCIASIREAQHLSEDSVIGALRNAFTRDTLATAVMRRLATKYQARNDTAGLLDMLKRILTIDFRDNDLRISTARLMVQMAQADSAVKIIDQGLAQNPASVELLGVKAIAMAAGSHWDSAAAALKTVADIDTSKVDSLFLYRITNYYRQIPDSTEWLRWVAVATQRFPGQLDYWYTLASQRMVHGDSAGAMEAAQGLLANLPADLSASAQLRGLAARAHYVVAMLMNGHGQVDSALVHSEQAVQLDSTVKGNVAVVYLLAGARARGDTATVGHLDRAIDLLTRARAYGAANQRLASNAAFQLGVAQFTKARELDQEAESSHSCDAVRLLGPLWDEVSASITAGARTNVDIANQILTAVPQFQGRAAAFARNFHCN